MILMSTHCRFIGFDEGSLIQLVDPDDPRVMYLDEHLIVDVVIESGPLKGFVISQVANGVTLHRDGKFACAMPGQAHLEINRERAQTWETFLKIPAESVGLFRRSSFSPEAEMARFADRVAYLTEIGEPIKLYCGAGTVPRRGFLNLDIDVNAPQFLLDHRDEYFIFPFVNQALPIPDSSVDYTFSEDFVEHISQLMQWQFFAEILRVMKPKSYHRVNTPSLIASMKRHSKFSDGFDGIYTGETQWDHISILTHFQLKEIAETIGYREVTFTTRSCGVSPYAIADFRPDADRNDVGGNIYADLLK